MPAVISFTRGDRRLPARGHDAAGGDRGLRRGDRRLSRLLHGELRASDPFPRRLTGGAWLERIGGIRANASKMSHAELDEAPELDDGDPEELGRDYARLMALLPRLAGARRLLRHRPPPHRGDQPCLRPRPRRLTRRSCARRGASDAADLARLVDLAGEGLPSYLWARMAEPGEDAFAVGERRRAARDEGAFSWRNAVDRRDRRRGRRRARHLPDRRRAGAARRRCRRCPAAAGAGEPRARHPVRQRARDLSGLPAPRRGDAAAGRGGRPAARRGRHQPDRRGRNAAARRLYAARLRRGGARADREGGLALRERRLGADAAARGEPAARAGPAVARRPLQSRRKSG